MLAPLAFNIQHWRFVLVQDPELHKQVRAVAWDQAQVTDASLLIILCADLKAWELHLAGATVLRGPMGFGANSRVHTAKILCLSEDLPIIIEIVDSKEKIDELTPHIDEMVQEGLVTLERVQVIKYSANDPNK